MERLTRLEKLERRYQLLVDVLTKRLAQAMATLREIQAFSKSHRQQTPNITISGLSVYLISDSYFAVTWTSSSATTSQVEYGPTVSYGSSSVLDSDLVTDHSVSVTGLDANTLYHFRVKSGTAASSDQTVTTARVHEGFNNTLSSYWNDNYTHAANYTPNTAQTPYVTTPRVDGTHALNYYVQPGDDEITSRQVGLSEFTPAITETYVIWHERYASGYPWPQGSQKMMRHIYYTEATGTANELLVNVTNSGAKLQCFWVEIANEGEAAAEVDNPIVADTWHQFVLWARLNDLGQANGFVKLWMDGTLYINLENQEQRTNSNTLGWNIMWVGGNYTNQGAVTGTGNRYIDELIWFNTKPSWYTI